MVTKTFIRRKKIVKLGMVYTPTVHHSGVKVKMTGSLGLAQALSELLKKQCKNKNPTERKQTKALTY